MTKACRKADLPNQASFRFYAELNDFLSKDRRGTMFRYSFSGSPSVKDMIESLGVPHTEIDLILVNGRSEDFAYLVTDGDVISVYPVFEAIDISPVLKLRPEPLRMPSFVVDVHLGGLARYLRMLGFDTLYDRRADDEELADMASQGRILLTKDRGLLKRKTVTHGYYVRGKSSMEQTVEVLRRFDLGSRLHPLSRCLHCNGRLQTVDKRQIEHRLEEDTRRYYEEFAVCLTCDRVYWQGSHYARMTNVVKIIRERLRRGME